MSQVTIGLQLYTVRDDMERDFFGTLEKVADIGYKAVEFAGYGGIDADTMRRRLDDLGLTALSSHVPLEHLKKDVQAEIDYCLTIGAKYIINPITSLETLRDDAQFDELMADFRRIGQACRDKGITFGYHNHDYEFDKVNGDYIIDRIYNAVSADVMVAQLDLFWVKKGGMDPVAWVKKYQGRTPLVHIKDMTGDEEATFAEIGSGIMDYERLLSEIGDAGIEAFIVEQDASRRTPLESIAMSFDYLRSIGLV